METTKKSKAGKLKHLFTSNWLSKLVSLFIAMGVWYTIFTHLEKTKRSKEPPVPGTIPIPKSPEPAPPIPILPGSGSIPGAQ
jgi:hypothetical protein